MSAARPYCDDCKRTFVDQNALWQHRKFHHRMGKADNPHPRPRDDDDSYAAIAMEAQRKQIAGEPLEDWEQPYRF